MRSTMNSKRIAVSMIFAAATTLVLVAGASGQATNYQQIPIPPLPAFHPQQPKRIALSNGLVIFLQEDHELPLIEGSARIRGGSRNEPGS